MTVSEQVGSAEAEEAYDEAEQLDDLNRAVGKQVGLLRERSGLTQKEIGDRLGYGPDLISSLERAYERRSASSWRRRTNSSTPVGC
ncbi:helix-turn-helix domain-containing protein [Streptomyces sp. NPDC017202]|uniref:helix-turn-helix domain-containing protein n=1 Tax=Streptomyces sp. NPDC017202 TaxID=3364981 RepID=UPI003788549B